MVFNNSTVNKSSWEAHLGIRRENMSKTQTREVSYIPCITYMCISNSLTTTAVQYDIDESKKLYYSQQYVILESWMSINVL